MTGYTHSLTREPGVLLPTCVVLLSCFCFAYSGDSIPISYRYPGHFDFHELSILSPDLASPDLAGSGYQLPARFVHG